MSLSATDLHVRLELPGDVAEENERATGSNGAKEIVVEIGVSETVSAEPRRILLTSVQVNSGETPNCDETARKVGIEDAPGVHEGDEGTAPGLVETPVVTSAETRVDLCARKTPKTPMSAVEIEGTAGGADRDGEQRKLTREIDVAAALSRRMTEDHPKLASAASFLNTVCGRETESKKSLVKKANTGKVTAATKSTVRSSRTDNAIEQTLSIKEVPHAMAAEKSGAGRGGGDVESDSDHDEPEVVVLEDTEMSGGESSGDESQSRSSFGGGSSSFCQSRASRKRAAEDSPEREHGGLLRQRFPGAISRGAGGCRVYLPTNIAVTSEDAVA